jgi:cytochrome P450
LNFWGHGLSHTFFSLVIGPRDSSLHHPVQHTQAASFFSSVATNMDLLICAGLATVEVLAATKFWAGGSGSRLNSLPVLHAAIGTFLAQYLTLKIYRIFLYHRYFSPLRHLPGPTVRPRRLGWFPQKKRMIICIWYLLTVIKNNHPIFGQSLNLIRAETPTTLYVQWMKEHPDAPFIRYLGFLNTEVLVPNSLAANKNVLHDNCYTFVKPQWFLRIVKEVAGHGLILMEGAEHRAHRRMLTNSFSLKSIRKLEPVFREKARDICRFFGQRISDHDGKTGTFDCIDTFMRAILDIMGTVILGVDLDYVKPRTGHETSQTLDPTGSSSKPQRECSFHEAYDVFFAPGTLGKLLLFANAHVPVRWLPLEANREFLSAMHWLNDVLLGIIRTRRREVAAAREAGAHQTSRSRDLVTFIVEESGPGGATEAMGEDEFLGHLLEIMAAGHDTSANMLSWSCYIMATRQDIQDRLRAELAAVSPDAPFAELDKLPYLECFAKECMRVYSPGMLHWIDMGTSSPNSLGTYTANPFHQ